MESLYILIPIAFVFVCIAVAVFFWSVKSGQFEDLDTEGRRILFDEKPAAPANQKHSTEAQRDKEEQSIDP